VRNRLRFGEEEGGWSLVADAGGEGWHVFWVGNADLGVEAVAWVDIDVVLVLPSL
jgi:hypothetical protein